MGFGNLYIKMSYMVVRSPRCQLLIWSRCLKTRWGSLPFLKLESSDSDGKEKSISSENAFRLWASKYPGKWVILCKIYIFISYIYIYIIYIYLFPSAQGLVSGTTISTLHVQSYLPSHTLFQSFYPITAQVLLILLVDTVICLLPHPAASTSTRTWPT